MLIQSKTDQETDKKMQMCSHKGPWVGSKCPMANKERRGERRNQRIVSKQSESPALKYFEATPTNILLPFGLRLRCVDSRLGLDPTGSAWLQRAPTQMLNSATATEHSISRTLKDNLRRLEVWINLFMQSSA